MKRLSMAKRLFIAVLTVASGMIAGPAWALSCLQPSPERAFNSYNEKPENYYIYKGEFQPIGAAPQGGGYNERGIRPPSVTMRFSGQGLGPQGLGVVESFRIVVSPECAGPWCAGYPGGDEAFYFLRQVPGGYSYEPTACPLSSLAYTRDNLNRLQRCYQGRCNDTGSIPNPIPTPDPWPNPGPQADTCGKALLETFIGDHVSTLPKFVRSARLVRIIRPTDAVTMDFNPERVNIKLGRGDVIRELQCN